MHSRHTPTLHELGLLPLWRQRSAPTVAQASTDNPTVVAPLRWHDELLETVRSCQNCELHQKRNQAVLGSQCLTAQVMFIGEGPGREEDLSGQPFVGQAGKLLDQMLLSIGLDRTKNVYIANAVKCRPPNNRTPTAQEIQACSHFLAQQITQIRPKLIVLMGRTAAQAILAQHSTLARMRQHVHQTAHGKAIVTFHPAYLLRNPAEKAKAWQDLLFIQENMA